MVIATNQEGAYAIARHRSLNPRPARLPRLQGLGAHKGFPDLTAIKDGRTTYIEVKTATGKQSEAQLEFQRQVESRGCEYIVARSTEDVAHLCDCLRIT